MAEWAIEQTREWLMRVLYESFLEDEQASMRWPETLEATESHPPGEGIVRESRQLATFGWIEILTEAYGNLFARMTPSGRDKWETFLKEKASDPTSVFSPQ